MSKYSLPKCDCGAVLDTYVEIKTNELKWKINKDGTWGSELISDDYIDTEKTYLKCNECGFTYECEEDSKGRIKLSFD